MIMHVRDGTEQTETKQCRTHFLKRLRRNKQQRHCLLYTSRRGAQTGMNPSGAPNGGPCFTWFRNQWGTVSYTHLNRNFDIAGDAEITIEVNPGTLLQNKLHIYRAAGINRLSIGLQSADNQELKDLGRIHTLSLIHI